ncbi:unnamed protein product [Schistocephalus solidus]|uniref:Reverse transcriptase/retrotransposon-derived protein RNase H-like domain-containing protein n=1 Tax=Schistocephalus solidus TaxID=70667 RepID=A0A3P7BYD7_SCHSO|nr:unnamed protein product [Schistocephalus solidus]
MPSLLAGSKRTFELTPAARMSFEQVKALVAGPTLLIPFNDDKTIYLMVDASNVAASMVKVESSAFTENESLTFALRSQSNKLKPREIRQLNYISQFTSSTDHGSRNEVADALPRLSITHPQFSFWINLAGMAAEERGVVSLCDENVS